jgi:hypothetical protein
MAMRRRAKRCGQLQNSLGFPGEQSDESSCAKRAEGNRKHMTNAEDNTTATVAERGAQGAREKTSAKKQATRAKSAPRAKNTAKGAKAAVSKKNAASAKKAARTKEAATPRGESKGAKVLSLIARPKGATLAELMKATEWRAHSIRGFISTASKKYEATIESSKNDKGERTYHSK